MRTLLWTYLGWRKFPRNMNAFDVQQFFSLSAADCQELRIRYPRRLRLGAALQLGFVRMTGTTLDAFDYVPANVMKHVAEMLGISAPQLATLRAMYRRRATLFAHQAWATKFAGFRWAEEADGSSVVESLTAGSAATLDPARLAAQAREELYARRCLIPGDREINDWVRRAIALVETDDRRHLDTHVYFRQRDAWLPALLRESHLGSMTVLEWIRRPPRKRSTKTLREEFHKLQTILRIGPPLLNLSIPAGRLRAYAHRMLRRRPAKIGQIAESRRLLEVGAMLDELAKRQSDVVLRLVEMRISEIWRWAHAVTTPASTAQNAEQTLINLIAALDNAALSDSHYRAQSAEMLAPWRSAASRLRGARAQRVRERLARDSRRVRPLLKLVLQLHLHSEPCDLTIGALAWLRDAYDTHCLTLDDAVVAPDGRAWGTLLRCPDRDLAFRAYEAATLWAVRRGLRNGSLWLPYAEHYGGRHRLVLPEGRWARARPAFCERHLLPVSGKDFVDCLTEQVQAGLEAVNEAVAAGEISVGKDSHLHLRQSSLPRHDTPASQQEIEPLRTRLYERVGRVQLPELLVAVDSETRFSWRLLGRAPSTPEELIPLYAAVLMAAMGLDQSEIEIMIPGVRPSMIRRASMLLEQERGLRQANDCVVEFLLAQPLSSQWGQGCDASSDLMSLDVSRHLWMARVDPKRRRHAVGTYTHVLDRWGVVYDMPLLLATRQAGAAIEGAVRQNISQLKHLAVDTHGYTDFAMLIAKLLGFDLCPRLSGMNDRRLHVPRGTTIPPALASIVRQDVSTAAIVAHWDQLLRVAASVEEGWRSATDVLEQFGSAARGDLTYSAGTAAGQLQRTVYLCDYFTLPDFRRTLHHVLERGESVHALQRQICSQALPAKRGRTIEALTVTSGALTLLTNCVMAWNTQRLQRAVDREAARLASPLSRDALAHIGPVGYRHINFRGTYRFPVDRYAERLVKTAA